MKLYTEEQIKIAYKTGYDDGVIGSNKHALKLYTPIELPTDEEIEKQSEYIAHNYFEMHNANHYQGLLEGSKKMAKWMKEQILGKEDKTFKQKSKWTEVDNMTRRLK